MLRLNNQKLNRCKCNMNIKKSRNMQISTDVFKNFELSILVLSVNNTGWLFWVSGSLKSMREFHSDIEYKQLSPWISKYYASRMSIDSLISINGSDLDPCGLSNIVEKDSQKMNYCDAQIECKFYLYLICFLLKYFICKARVYNMISRSL